jgi:hypothetical protein
MTALTYDAARDALSHHLLNDAAAHQAERYDEIGRRFDGLEDKLPRGSDPQLTKLHVAMTFWDGWIDARNNGWPDGAGFKQAEWPVVAREIAADLMADRDITNPRVTSRFDAEAHSSLGDRVSSLTLRLRGR